MIGLFRMQVCGFILHLPKIHSKVVYIGSFIFHYNTFLFYYFLGLFFCCTSHWFVGSTLLLYRTKVLLALTQYLLKNMTMWRHLVLLTNIKITQRHLVSRSQNNHIPSAPSAYQPSGSGGRSARSWTRWQAREGRSQALRRGNTRRQRSSPLLSPGPCLRSCGQGYRQIR